ncbi:apolipoprotein N-acyltransferase [Novosphingobium album (ex Liu et al. 2023)]|uniref:Apolipoprotein N-acyltransferase n=1 Tax=Novosphingobium album (ex Liu et al. 2023) TaxID=3031130 RepID=A0ABT5WT50_9SPHN|nr:apolipoprotein N-acyltransferase [Novosphingobium album (ex Liu et al. 2023)]MDE8653036.1 apolipoprotein N-acyltransferase [Novosphingobium album (ex Liu et al. 2023)]
MDSIRDALSACLRFERTGALFAGALAACGFQPLSLWPLTIVALAWLIELLARARSARGAFLIGWCFGLGHFTVGDNWIATAFTYQAQMPTWLGAIAVVLLSLYLAIFPALAILASWLFVRRLSAQRDSAPDGPPPPPERLRFVGLVLPACWIITEWMRAWVFTGFAWNPLGVALLGQYETQGLALLTPWIGTYGLSGLLVGIAALVRLLLCRAARAAGGPRIGWAAGLAALSVALGTVMIAPAAYLAREEGAIHYTLIQPDLRQETLGDPRLFEAHFLKMARLTLPRSRGERRVVFWPESGLADYLRDGYPPWLYRQMTYAADPDLARDRIGTVIGPYGLLLTGAVDLVIEDGDEVAARNSVTAIDGGGHILAGYSKAHLVPFGEYLALRWLLEPLGATRLVAGTLDFWPGPGPRSFDFGDWGKAGVQICYEIVFSGEVVDRADRPDYIFNPSNDGWFGSWGPPQHLAQARLRAIEEGLPVLRSTTTGISAVIDADGIVRGHIRRHTAGRLDGAIPPAHEPTPFARFGNALPLAYAILLLGVSVVALRRSRE